MAHTCPECGMLCHCGGDIDDMEMDGTPEQDRCSHCPDEDNDRDRDQSEIDADKEFRDSRYPMPNEIPQDSVPDTLAHIKRVRELIDVAIYKLDKRSDVHDQSKLWEPEKSAFDRLKSLSLSGMAYGSEEYRACLRKEKPAIEHHYKANSHHPEYFENGVDGMSLFDVLEMLLDWKAATERMKDGGDIRASLVHNTERFKLSPQLVAILENTIKEMHW